MAYVALSRFKTLEGIHLIHFAPWIIRCAPPAFEEMRRLRRKLLSPGERLPEVRCNQLPPEHCRIGVAVNTTDKRRGASNRNLKTAFVQAQAPAQPGPSVYLNSAFVFSRRVGENTCYANASVSALLHLDPIRESLDCAATGHWVV